MEFTPRLADSRCPTNAQVYEAIALRFALSLGVLMLLLFSRGDGSLGLGLNTEIMPIVVVMASVGIFAAKNRCAGLCDLPPSFPSIGPSMHV